MKIIYEINENDDSLSGLISMLLDEMGNEKFIYSIIP